MTCKLFSRATTPGWWSEWFFYPIPRRSFRYTLTAAAFFGKSGHIMDFIDDPQFGHTKMRLPVILVPVLMFAVLLLGIWASKLYVAAVEENPPAAH